MFRRLLRIFAGCGLAVVACAKGPKQTYQDLLDETESTSATGSVEPRDPPEFRPNVEPGDPVNSSRGGGNRPPPSDNGQGGRGSGGDGGVAMDGGVTMDGGGDPSNDSGVEPSPPEPDGSVPVASWTCSFDFNEAYLYFQSNLGDVELDLYVDSAVAYVGPQLTAVTLESDASFFVAGQTEILSNIPGQTLALRISGTLTDEVDTFSYDVTAFGCLTEGHLFSMFRTDVFEGLNQVTGVGSFLDLIDNVDLYGPISGTALIPANYPDVTAQFPANPGMIQGGTFPLQGYSITPDSDYRLGYFITEAL